MNIYIKEMRLQNWLKNIFVFVPIVFALEITNIDKVVTTIMAFAAFCLASSAVYVFNDIYDASKDAVHPVKCNRPIASGAITKPKAAIFSILLATSGIVIGLFAKWSVCVFIAVYLALNLSYNLWLKQKPIFDCFCIAIGFVLRVYTGSAASEEMVSDWLFLTVVAMALFMAFGKRRGELIKTEDTSTRAVLERYNIDFLKGMVFICAGLSIVFYALWTMNRGNNMIYTVPLIIFIVAKYLLLIHDSESHGDPTTVIYSDRTMFVACGMYTILTITLLYMGK